MNEPGDQVATTCPACSPTRETVHEVLAGGGRPTVRCTACDHVHTAALEDRSPDREVRAVISQAGESVATTVAVPTDATLAVGDEFVAETEAASYAVEITSLEGSDGDRHDRLDGSAVATVWTRDVGNVAVDVTVHPPENADDRTYATTLWVAGDRPFEVGTEETVDGESVRVQGIVRREAAVEAGSRRLDAPGDRVRARDVTRLYVRSRRHVPDAPW